MTVLSAGPIGRIILEQVGGGYVALPWDAATSVALLPGGLMQVRQGGAAYTYQGATGPVAPAPAVVISAADLVAGIQNLVFAVNGENVTLPAGAQQVDLQIAVLSPPPA